MTTSVVIRLVLILIIAAVLAYRFGWLDGLISRGSKKSDEQEAARRRERERRQEAVKREEDARRQEDEKRRRILGRASESAEPHSLRLGKREVHYVSAGSRDRGRPVLFLHDFGRSKEDWGPVLDRLSSLGCHVVAPDLPGFGQSEPLPDEEADVLPLARRVKALASKLALDPCHLVGSGLGGTLAMLWACKEPDQVSSLTLIEPLGFRVPYPTPLDEADESTACPLLPTDPGNAQAVHRLLFQSPPTLDPELESLRQGLHQQRREHLQALWTRLRADDRRGLLDLLGPELRCPLLYLQGGASRIVHPKTADLMRSTLHDSAEIHVLDDCGHLPALERPEETGSILLRFLQRVEQDRAAAS